MNVNNINSANFKGYKNVLANKVFRPNGEQITYISMQLDNVGKNDLETWKFLQKNLIKRDFTNDVLTFNVYEREDFNVMGFSSDLMDIDEVQQSSEDESLMMKAFSFIASLTNRIKQDNSIIYDYNYRSMAYDTKADLTDVLFGEKQGSMELDNAVFGAYYSKYTPMEIAAEISNKISEKMLEYFS